MKKNVLIFPAGTEIANEIISSLLLNRNYNLILASSVQEDYSSYRSNPRYYLPSVYEIDFLDRLNLLIDENEISYIIPAHDDVAYKLSEIEDCITAEVIGQDFRINDIARFKDKTYEYFQGIIPLAKIFDHSPSESDFPIFVKPKKGQGSFDSLQLQSLKEFNSFFDSRNIEDYVIMELLTGGEFTIDCFSDNGKVLYCGARTREKVTKGISVLSRLVNDKALNDEFFEYASLISSNLNMHGLWFFQMKFDKDNQLKLLEIATRVSGTMMLNRIRGVNFVELAILQKQKINDLELAFNNIQVSLSRALTPVYKHNISYQNLYIDFDDTLCLDDRYINANLMKLIFEAKNQEKNVYLLTKNQKNNLASILNKFGISSIFDAIYHLKSNEKKINFMKPCSVLIDDSFSERRSAIKNGFFAFSTDNFSLLFVN